MSYKPTEAFVGREISGSRNQQAISGGLAQLARALALQARGHRFESDILHERDGDAREEEEKSRKDSRSG